jgi:hypothetical protein
MNDQVKIVGVDFRYALTAEAAKAYFIKTGALLEYHRMYFECSADRMTPEQRTLLADCTELCEVSKYDDKLVCTIGHKESLRQKLLPDHDVERWWVNQRWLLLDELPECIEDIDTALKYLKLAAERL